MVHPILRFIAYLNTKKNRLKHKRGLKRGPYHMFFINHVHKSVYVENPKAASRSILQMFQSAHIAGMRRIACSVPKPRIAIALPCYKSWIPHLFVFSKWRLSHETRDWLSERELQTYYFFTFVRNPFDRIVSGYTNKVISSTPIKPPADSGAATWHEFLGFEAGTDLHTPEAFKRFVVRYIVPRTDQQLDVHFKTQHLLVIDCVPHPLSFIGHVEQLEDDWNTLASSKHVPAVPNITYANKSVQRNAYETYFGDAEVVELVYQRYKKDVDAFNYTDAYKQLLEQHVA